MIRMTDWFDVWAFANQSDDKIITLYVNVKHYNQEDVEYFDALKKPPVNISEIIVTPFISIRDSVLMMASTDKGMLVLDERYGFTRIKRVPLWYFLPEDRMIGKAVVATRAIDHIWDEYDVDEDYVTKGEVGVIVDIYENGDRLEQDVDVQFGQYTYYNLILGIDVVLKASDE